MRESQDQGKRSRTVVSAWSMRFPVLLGELAQPFPLTPGTAGREGGRVVCKHPNMRGVSRESPGVCGYHALGFDGGVDLLGREHGLVVCSAVFGITGRAAEGWSAVGVALHRDVRG